MLGVLGVLDMLGVLGDIKTKLFHWRLLVRVCKSLIEAEGGFGSQGKVEGLVKAAGSGAVLPGAAAARGFSVPWWLCDSGLTGLWSPHM